MTRKVQRLDESFIIEAVEFMLSQQNVGASLQSSSTRGIPQVYAEEICRLLDQEPSLKPAECLHQLKLMYTNDTGNLPSDFPTAGKLKSKISATKSARKKLGMSK